MNVFHLFPRDYNAVDVPIPLFPHTFFPCVWTKSSHFMCENLRNKNSIAPSNFICVFISVLLWTSASDAVTGIHLFCSSLPNHSPFRYAFTCMNGFCPNEWMPTEKAIGRAMCGPAFFHYSFWNRSISHVASKQQAQKQPYENLFNASPSFENNGNSIHCSSIFTRTMYLSLRPFFVQSKQNQQNINIMLENFPTIWKHTAAAKWILCLISSIQLHLKEFFANENLLVSLNLEMNPKSSRFSIATENCAR